MEPVSAPPGFVEGGEPLEQALKPLCRISTAIPFLHACSIIPDSFPGRQQVCSMRLCGTLVDITRSPPSFQLIADFINAYGTESGKVVSQEHVREALLYAPTASLPLPSLFPSEMQANQNNIVCHRHRPHRHAHALSSWLPLRNT